MASPDINPFRTPTKGIINNFNSNSYLAYSSLYGSNEFNSSKYNWTNQKNRYQRTGFQGYNSNINERSSGAESSSIVLQQALTQADIAQFFEAKKIIQFLGSQELHQKAYLSRKQKLMNELVQNKTFLQHKISQQKLKYEKKKRELVERKKRKEQMRRKRNSVLQKQMQKLELQIIKMRWSQSKSKFKTPQKNMKQNSAKQFPSNHPLYASQKQKIKNNLFHNPYYYQNGFNPQVCQSAAHNTKKQQKMPGQKMNNRQNMQMQYQQSANPQRVSNNYSESQYKSSTHPNNNSSKYSNAVPKSKYSNPFNFLAQKLSQEPNIALLTRNTNLNKKDQQINQGLISEQDIEQVQSDFEKPKEKAIEKNKQETKKSKYLTGPHNSQTFQININSILANKLVDTVVPDDDPLDICEDKINFDYLNQNSQEIKKDIVVSNHNINAEDNEQDLQMLNILQQSVRMSQRKKASQILKNAEKENQIRKPEVRSAIGAKLIESNIGQQDYHLDIPQKNRMMQNSNVDISYESGEQVKFNKSSDSGSGHSTHLKKQDVKRHSIRQSNVNILIEQSGQSPKFTAQQSPIYSKKQLALRQKIEALDNKMSNIQQLDEQYLSRKDTPVNLQDQFHFDVNITESRLAVSQKSNKIQKMTGSTKGQLQLSDDTPRSPPLTKPPSLTDIQEEMIAKQRQQIDEGDDFGLNSIKLSVQSRVRKPGDSPSRELNSYLTQKSQSVQDPDDIFSIKLATQSKISRQSKSRLKENPIQELQIQMQSQKALRGSQGKLQSRGLLQQQVENTQFEDVMRSSAKSSIVRKGSAIQKIRNRQNVNNIRMSNYQSSSHLGKSNELFANAIEEAEEQQQDGPPSSNRKHTKNAESSYL